MRYRQAKKQPDTKETIQRLSIAIGHRKQNIKYGKSKKLIFTSTENIASDRLDDKNELRTVRIKKETISHKLRLRNLFKKNSASILKNDVITHRIIIPERSKDPKGRQKQKRTGKK